MAKNRSTGSINIPIIVVTTNAEKQLTNWLSSIEGMQNFNDTEKAKRNLNGINLNIVPCIVDNASSDCTPGIIWDAINSKKIKNENVFWLHKNQWFVSAQNYAIRQLGVRGEFKFFATLNENATAEQNWLHELIKSAYNSVCDNSKAGMYCGIIKDSNTKQIVSSAGHWLRKKDGAFLDIGYKKKYIEIKEKLNAPQFEPFSPCFAAGLWSFEMIQKVGLPDNDQLIYYDDVELAYKARLKKWKVCFVPKAIAYHPCPKKSVDPIRLNAQLRGRILLVGRYFPNEERLRIFKNEKSKKCNDNKDKAIIDKALIESPKDSEDNRQIVFKDWGDKNNF